MTSDILIVDDEADIRELVAGILQDEGHDTRTAGDSDEALSAVAERLPNLVFLDIWLRGSRLDVRDRRHDAVFNCRKNEAERPRAKQATNFVGNYPSAAAEVGGGLFATHKQSCRS